MTKPIEVIHQNFELKLTAFAEIVQRFRDSGAVPGDLCDELSAQHRSINAEYVDHTLRDICDYFLADTFKLKCEIVDRYLRVVVSRNFATCFADVTATLKSVAEKYNVNDVETRLLFKQYEDTHVETETRVIDYKTCQMCSAKMAIHPQRSEMRCTECPYIVVLKGTAFDETTLYTSDGVLAKRGSYEPSRHCRYHLDRILAIKNPNFSEKFLDKVRAWMKRNNYIYPKLVTCPIYRRCLKDIKETRHNENVPFLRQLLSGVSPERLYYHEQRLLFIYFDKADTMFKKIKGGDRANLRYYPYFIFKIIEMILSADEDKKRLRSIIDCIHFQRDNTIVANDRLWRRICDEIPEFTFKKTDTNLFTD